MKINSFIIFVIIFFFNSGSAESLAYLDMTSVYNNSLVGKSIKVDINKFKDELINDLKKKEKLFIEKEKQLISKKNIIGLKEYNKELSLLKKEIITYKKYRINKEERLKQKQFKANSLLMKHLTPIITAYSKENSISLLIDKKNIIIGKSSLDITDDIIIILDKKINKLDLTN